MGSDLVLEPVYLLGLRADVGFVEEEEERFLDFFLLALAIASAMEETGVVDVLGFFFAGELDGEDEFAVGSVDSVSPSSFGLLISLMMSLMSSAP